MSSLTCRELFVRKRKVFDDVTVTCRNYHLWVNQPVRVMGALIRRVFLRHVSRIKKMGICPPFGVLDTHFSLLPQEQTSYNTRSNNDARHCNFTYDCDFTLFTASLSAMFVRASLPFFSFLHLFQTDNRVCTRSVDTRRILCSIPYMQRHARSWFFQHGCSSSQNYSSGKPGA